MLRIYAGIAALALAALIGGTALYVSLSRGDPCAGGVVAGGAGAIGGPFTLVDGEGRTVTDAEVIDGPTLIYFGYTFCPDVCPLDTVRNADAVDLLAARGIEVTPVFITVDPARDTPEVVGEYARAFHPAMIGLSGSPEQVDAARGAYRVFASKGAGEGDDYLVNHSAFTYLMRPGSGLAAHFGREVPAEKMAEEIACALGV